MKNYFLSDYQIIAGNLINACRKEYKGGKQKDVILKQIKNVLKYFDLDMQGHIKKSIFN